MDFLQVAERLAAGGFATFLLVLIIAGRYKVWVWGYQLDDAIKDKDRQIEQERVEKEMWRGHFIDARQMTDKSVDLATKLARK